MNEPQNLTEHQIKKIANEPQISKQPQISKET
jgi:hypothetical protein